MSEHFRARVVAIVDAWRPILGLPADLPIDVQVGDISELVWEQRGQTPADAYGVTFASPDNTAYCIGIDPRAETCEDGLEHVVVHELLHVLAAHEGGPGERDQMEYLIDLAAMLLIGLRHEVQRAA